MSRLSNRARDEIARRMTAYAFNARLEEAQALVGQCVYEQLMTPARKAIPETFLKDGWIASAEMAAVVFYYGPEIYAYDNVHVKLPGRVPARVDEFCRGYSTDTIDLKVHFGDKSPLAQALAAKRDLEAERFVYKDDVLSVCASCTTVKQLLETLPEAKDFLPEEVGASHALVDQALLKRVKQGFTAANAAKEQK